MAARTDLRRVTILNTGAPSQGPVVYWMSRDQRAQDNWALIYAAEVARDRGVPLGVVFCLVPQYLGAGIRHYSFMLSGLQEVESSLTRLDVPFFLALGEPERVIPQFVNEHSVAVLVTDFSPLKLNRQWVEGVARRIDVPLHEVDAHNIIPCRQASQKQEYAAYTIRPKIRKLVNEYLVEFPEFPRRSAKWMTGRSGNDWSTARRSLKVDTGVPEVSWLVPGETAAREVLDRFLAERLVTYSESRNDPTRNGQSDLSPYLHFGQISAQRVALEVQRHDDNIKSQEAFLEELITRRELSDNFCFHNREYDSYAAFPAWARRTLEAHSGDPREHIYDREQLEAGETHDDLWNAAQHEMVHLGKMHGYLRMYWAKKILEWSVSAKEALTTAIYLNDKYELDGRDPNGYAGIAWSIGGLHDRAWAERSIFGKIRYMSYNGCRRKFDVEAYIAKVVRLRTEVVS
jgi:deoxyribodipyrimidine photo-lyase